jgi:6-phosphogluconate dehydrogenase
MQLGVIGAGRMGSNLARRLTRAGHQPIVTDRDQAALAPLEAEGIQVAGDLARLVAALDRPRALWIMVPAGAVDGVVAALAEGLDEGDLIIDGGNSHWRHGLDRAAGLEVQGIGFLDVGTSGGVHGLERGYCLMIGGDAGHVEHLRPIWEALAPGADAAPRTRNRAGRPDSGEAGWLHCGPSGSGHFVKMVHNGIEYGMMAAYAEGLNLLHEAGDAGLDTGGGIDVAAVAEVWRRGSVIGSWLLDLTAAALVDDPALDGFSGWVSDSGEGRWAVQAAIEAATPVPVLSAALYQRFASRDQDGYARRLLSAMRHEFGGHTEPGGESA